VSCFVIFADVCYRRRFRSFWCRANQSRLDHEDALSNILAANALYVALELSLFEFFDVLTLVGVYSAVVVLSVFCMPYITLLLALFA